MKKVQISIDDELLERLDKYAENNYMSRSGFIALACNNYLSSVEALSLIRSLDMAMRKIADTGVIDFEAQKQLEEFERFSSMILGGKK